MSKPFIEKGTTAYTKVNIAFFLAGFTIFSVLYSVQPLMPFFVQHYHVTPTIASLTLSISTLVMAISLIFFGALSEVIGRKSIMIFSVIAVSILSLLQPFASNFTLFLAVRFMQGFVLAGLPAIAMAYISEEVHPRSITSAIGLYISGNALGGAFGRIFTGSIAGLYGYQAGLLSIAILSSIAAILFSLFIPNSKHFTKSPLQFKPLIASYRHHLTNKDLIKPFILGFLFLGSNIAMFNYISFELIAPPYNISTTIVSFIYLLFLLGMVASIMSGKLTDTFGRYHTMKFAIILYLLGIAITLLPFAIFKIIGLAFAVFGFFSGHALASSLVGSIADHHKAQATSLYLLFYYIGSSVGGTVGGLFYDIAGWYGVAMMVTLFMITAFLIIVSMSKPITKHIQTH
ncbi:MFS transporter [Macrococcus animalis]|uniref:MFS transporter n=1 Tax=Macrococcus animalis TaxID=3395467 RepID=UPI0039BE3313